MREEFEKYIFNLYQDVPSEIYVGLLSLLCIVAIGFFVILGWKRVLKKVVGLLLAEYVFLIYCSTVICRKVTEGISGHNYTLFWSYEAIKNGREDLVAENIMNVVVFVPVGLLTALVIYNKQKLFKTGQLIVFLGLFISSSIETLQLLLERGFSELDDVFHNTLGCLIGFMTVAIIKGIWLLQKRYIMSFTDTNEGNKIDYIG